jgi:hypothetical protein
LFDSHLPPHVAVVVVFTNARTRILAMSATLKADLENAIKESRQFNRIVAVEVSGVDIADVVAEIHAIIDGECDYSQENDGQYDVYGWSDETREWEHDWRLSVRIVGGDE